MRLVEDGSYSLSLLVVVPNLVVEERRCDDLTAARGGLEGEKERCGRQRLIQSVMHSTSGNSRHEELNVVATVAVGEPESIS